MQNYFDSLLAWRSRHISQRQLLYALSIIIGILSGLAAVILKTTVYYTRYFVTKGFNIEGVNFLFLFLPLFGILITYLFVRYIVKDDISHGISRILWSISRNRAKLENHDNYSSLAGSTITVGFGGSVGLEAPIVLTGSAIGSNLGRLFRLEPKALVLLIGCGAAGAIAGIFKAPIAGILFALEVLMLDMTISSVIPLLLSSIAAATIASILMGKSVLFSFQLVKGFNTHNIPFYILLGILSGFVSLYFTRCNLLIENWFERIRSGWTKVIIGGLAVSLLVFIFPPFFGEGYESLKDLLNGRGEHLTDGSIFYLFSHNHLIFMTFVFLILSVKVVAMSITTGSGGVGGVFAPSLFVGGVSGYFLSKSMNFITGTHLPETHFVLAGMAGVMAGVMQAPLTAIFLIAEITGGYELLIPLMITATISYITIRNFEHYSVYTKRLAEKGQLISRNKDKVILSQMSIDDLIETNFNTIGLNDYLGDLVKEVSISQRNIFPVVDREDTFYGIIFIDDVRDVMFKQELYGKILVKNLMFMPEIYVEYGSSMEEVVKKFEETDNYNLVVLKEGKYMGFVSRANIFTAYRELLNEMTREE